MVAPMVLTDLIRVGWGNQNDHNDFMIVAIYGYNLSTKQWFLFRKRKPFLCMRSQPRHWSPNCPPSSWTITSESLQFCAENKHIFSKKSAPHVVPKWSTCDLSASYLISSKRLLFKNIAHEGSFHHCTWLCLDLPCDLPYHRLPQTATDWIKCFRIYRFLNAEKP